jgi:hypothetical protein
MGQSMTERWVDRVPVAPGGVYGAWFNTIAAAALTVVGTVATFTSVEQPAGRLPPVPEFPLSFGNE